MIIILLVANSLFDWIFIDDRSLVCYAQILYLNAIQSIYYPKMQQLVSICDFISALKLHSNH